MIVGIDVDGYRGMIPRPFQNAMWEFRIGTLYIVATYILFSWIAMLNAKGSKVELPRWAYIVRAILWVVSFTAGFLFPAAVFALTPSNSPRGIYNAKLECLKYFINGAIGFIAALIALVYGVRIVQAMKKGGTVTAERQAAVNKIIKNIVVLCAILTFGFGYAALLFVTRIDFCYLYDPPDTAYWFSPTQIINQ